VRVGGPLVGAEDDEGFKIGDQAMLDLETCAQDAELLRANRQICCCFTASCQPPNVLPLSALTFEDSCCVAAAAPAIWRLGLLELLLDEGHISLSLGRVERVLTHLRERCEPVVDDPEEVVKIRIDFVRYR
jgi:hypothetical protein